MEETCSNRKNNNSFERKSSCVTLETEWRRTTLFEVSTCKHPTSSQSTKSQNLIWKIPININHQKSTAIKLMKKLTSHYVLNSSFTVAFTPVETEMPVENCAEVFQESIVFTVWNGLQVGVMRQCTFLHENNQFERSLEVDLTQNHPWLKTNRTSSEHDWAPGNTITDELNWECFIFFDRDIWLKVGRCASQNLSLKANIFLHAW